MRSTTYSAHSLREADGRVTLVVCGVTGYELGQVDAPADPFDREAVRAALWLSKRTGCPVGEIRRELWRVWLHREAA